MKDSFSEINVVPLVDIMLVLIVIVLITANFMAQGMVNVELPRSESEQHMEAETLRLEVDASGIIFMEKHKVSLAELGTMLRGINRERPVLISADKNLTLQPFISLIDELKKFGFKEIGVHTAK